MSQSLSVRLIPETIRSLDYTSVGSAYMGIGSAFDKPIRILYITNLTDKAAMFSLDGIDDHFALPSNGFLLLDIAANKTREQGYYIAENTRVYAKEITTPTTGTIYVSAFYGA